MSYSDYSERKVALETEISHLKRQLSEKEESLTRLINNHKGHSLSIQEVARFCRQIIVPEIGVEGQEKIKNGKVLIVGCGGLGCPAAHYLVGCGVGRIGLVDYDKVEENNLHRQMLYTESMVGSPKTKCAAEALKKLNHSVQIDEYKVLLNSQNALDIIQKYDIVLDASDNPATRYLISDACVLAKKPFVHGSAVQLDGQITVYNYKGGPCYRCLFKEPPPPSMVNNCNDSGVLGPVPGVIGTLQALQTIHILLDKDDNSVLSGRMVLFDGFLTKFREIKIRGRMPDCASCGDSPEITRLIDYESFCGAPASDKEYSIKVLNSEERISPEDLCEILVTGRPHVLVDVRPPNEFRIGNIPGSINIPISKVDTSEGKAQLIEVMDQVVPNDEDLPVYVICRRGNDSQLAVTQLKNSFVDSGYQFFDVKGGLYSWAKNVDPTFPIY